MIIILNHCEFIQNNQTFKNIMFDLNKMANKECIEIFLPHLFDNSIIKILDISLSNKGDIEKSIPLLKEIILKSNVKCVDINYISNKNKNKNIIVGL